VTDLTGKADTFTGKVIGTTGKADGLPGKQHCCYFKNTLFLLQNPIFSKK